MKYKIFYFLICFFLIIFQFSNFFNDKTLYIDNPFLIVFSTLVVLLLPGILVYPFFESMAKAYRYYGVSSFFTFVLAFSFIVEFFLCIIVFVLNLNIYQSMIILFIFNFFLFIASIIKMKRGYVPYIQISLKRDFPNNIVFIFFIILLSFLLYRLGANPYDIGGEMLLQLATVRKIFENSSLAVNNVGYSLGMINTYIFPIWQFIVALISKIANIDPLIVYFKMRWCVALFSLIPISALINLIFKNNRYNSFIINVIIIFVLTSLYITDYKATTISDPINRGVFNLLPTLHIADIAMVILMPIGIYLILFYIEHKDKIFVIFLTAFFFMLSVFHIREYFQISIYFLILGFVIFIVNKKKLRNYFFIFISISIAGLLMFFLQMYYAEQLFHMGVEFNKKKELINELIQLFKNNPLLLIKKSDFYGFGDLNMDISLLTFYFLPCFFILVKKNINTIFIITTTILCFLFSQTTIFKKILLLITYSEFFVSTARLVFIFIFIIVSYLITEIILNISNGVEKRLKKKIRKDYIVNFLSNMVGIVLIFFIFIFLYWYIRDGRLENLLRENLFMVSWIYFFSFSFLLFKKKLLDNYEVLEVNSKKIPFFVVLFLILIPFCITPNIVTSFKNNKFQSENLWTDNVITNMPIELINFLREKIPQGSIFAINTASKTSIFLYVNVYIDHFPPLISDNIGIESEINIRKFDENRPIYGKFSDMNNTKTYIKIKKINYILLEPQNSEYLKDRFDKERTFFKKIYDKNDYIVYEVIS